MEHSKLLTGLFIVAFALTSACSSTRKKNAENTDAAAATETTAPDEKTQLKNKVEELTLRLGDLEKKMTELNQKLEQAPQVGSGKLKTEYVTGGPADRGTLLGDASIERDPEAGFSQGTAVQKFRDGMVQYNAQKYREGALSFSQFLNKYPDHPLAGAAQFYVADSYYQIKDLKIAHDEFTKLLAAYDRSSYVPEALGRLYEIQMLMNKKSEAEKSRMMLFALFAQSTAAGQYLSETKAPAIEKTEKPAPAKKAETPQLEATEKETPAGSKLDEPPVPTTPEHT